MFSLHTKPTHNEEPVNLLTYNREEFIHLLDQMIIFLMIAIVFTIAIPLGRMFLS